MSTTGGFDPYSPQPPEEPIPVVLPVEPDLPLVVVPVEPPKPPHPGFWWSVLWCLAFLVVTQFVLPVMVLLPISVVEVLRIRQESATPSNPDQLREQVTQKTLVPTFVMAQVAGAIFALSAIVFVVGKHWTRELALRRPSAAHTVLALLGFPSLLVLGNLVFLGMKQVLPSLKDLLRLLPGLELDISGVEEMVGIFRQMPTGLAVLLIGIGPGLTEELWCRGFLGRGLVGRYGPVIGVLLTSFFFGAIHIDPQQAAYAMVMGLVLHAVYLMTHSLWLPILLHFLNNSAAVVHDKLPGLDRVLPLLDEPSPLMIVSALLLFATVSWALFESRTRIRAKVGSEGSAWKPSFPGVEHPPPGSGAFVERTCPRGVTWGLVLAAVVLFGASVYWVSLTKKAEVKPSPAAGVIVS